MEVEQVNYRNDFGKLLGLLGLTNHGIEIGVSEGNFSEIIVSNFGLSKIYLVDPWKEYPKEEYPDSTNCSQKEQDERYQKVLSRMEKYGDRVAIIRKESIEVSKCFDDEYFDFIYIDANHTYESTKQDIEEWYPKLKKGGVFAGHDYRNGVTRLGTYGVKKAVDEFCHNIKAKLSLTKGTRRCPLSWYFIKEEIS